MEKFTEGRHAGEHVLSEANGSRSREQITINATAGKLAAGTVLGKRTTVNSGTAAADAGNTGNGTMSGITVADGALTGAYVVTITEAATNGGTFSVTDPLGNIIGTGSVGVEFSEGGLTFTLADGATDFEAEDFFTITAVEGVGEWVAYDDDGLNDGRRVASGILYAEVDATSEDVTAVAHVRDCEVDASALTGLDDNARADLLALGIICR